jgi:hypothetical protein
VSVIVVPPADPPAAGDTDASVGGSGNLAARQPLLKFVLTGVA